MTFASLPRGALVFVDANAFVYHFTAHPVFGPASRDLLKRIETGELLASTSTHVVAECMHCLMTIEATTRFGWTQGKVIKRLRQHPDAVKQLGEFQAAHTRLRHSPLQIMAVTPSILDAAVSISQQLGLLTNDALLLACMQAHGLSNLASNDADFDRVPGIHRYAPV